MSNIFKIIIFFSFITFSLYPSTQVSASKPVLSEQQLKLVGFKGYENINTNQLIYPIKRFYEEVKLSFIKDPQKRNEYSAQLLESRLNELVYIANFNKTGFLNTATSRYKSSIIETLTPEQQSQNSELKNKILRYIKILEITRDIYPANTTEWLFIQQSIDVTHQYAT